MELRQVAASTAAGRIAIGAGLVVAPKLAGRAWLGSAVDSPGTQVALRALGIRDLALGIGVLSALDTSERGKNWVAAALASDLVDALATVAAGRGIPAAGRRLVVAMAVAGAALSAAYLATEI